ncbi:Co2+/Mg2+ efflux protein ApaG [Thiorhodospira sibirica]|uniref:Co2+/Mg2+ efflux protein ApaG n=1 Tax=Thiorhodospira sibirica TaxID=154347 RepID=UPI00022C1D11|nr:Co2+/Mg2+ efflux protein ApaG [Thiorhodospira sibirica]
MDTDKPHDIRIQVQSFFVEAQSDPEQAQYVFAYTVTIRNEGKVAARLLRRHWIINDANGQVREVHGEGVVGEQPYLRPGEGFRYTSGAMIETPVATMQGSYEWIDDTGQTFKAPIPRFTLSIPRVLH